VAFGVGIAGTAVGIGIGAPHLAKGGEPVPTVAGIASLGAGLFLLIGGATLLVRSAAGWWKVGTAVAAVLFGAPLIVAWATAVAATNVPRTRLGPKTPADLGYAYRDVEFAATDGVMLSGWYIDGDNGAAVVLLHGAGSTRSAALDHAAVLARHRFSVLLFDARGHGRSSGRAMDFGWFGDEDVSGAVTFAAAQPGVERIGVVGLSMGGEEAIGAAASDSRIRAVVAEGATSRQSNDKAWLPREYGVRGWLQRPVDWLTTRATDILTEAEPPTTLRSAASATTAPLMLITAGNVADEAHAARHIATGAPDRVTVWNVPGTGHTGALRTQPDQWERRVSAFLRDALGAAHG
jgi:pimeloyl-ACP methyl ester carboxylesterase